MNAAPADHNHSFELVDGAYTCTGCGAWINEKERKLMAIRQPTLCRLELYTPTGWVTHLAAVNLLFPERYPERLEERRKYGRAVELGENLKPTGRKWEPTKLPRRTALVPTGTPAYGLPDPARQEYCRWCGQSHGDPFDGSCLL